MNNIIANFKAAWYAVEILIPVAVFCLALILLLSWVYKKYIRCRFWRSGVVSVSYTHLDVYKRQVHGW